jgi:hypothetical protein
VLSYVRRIDERLDTVDGKLDEAITRISQLEYHFAGFQHELAAVNLWLDNLDRRVNRIERWLDQAAETPRTS